MGVYDSPTKLRVAQRKRFAAVIHDMAKVHTILAHDGKDDFSESTTGTIKQSTLTAMGHPFGRIKSGNPLTGGRGIAAGNRGKFRGVGLKGQVTAKGVVRPLPINRQSGRLHASIQLVGPIGRRKEYRLFSSAPEAAFVLRPGGTRFMIDRGLLGPTGLLMKRHKARIAAVVDVVRATGRKP
jgi:hypothetical protein